MNLSKVKAFPVMLAMLGAGTLNAEEVDIDQEAANEFSSGENRVE